ncbi:hypothetical protein FF38_05455 [Lucilia cuprina]|uniref:Uncharacterized protein n=1 Tax=Lucilia cuprina TaxID=7375 RepID=A0A0L0CA76_LUCCU|nr:hypothetical protein FF38_05455 [Lucilia cuprina]
MGTPGPRAITMDEYFKMKNKPVEDLTKIPPTTKPKRRGGFKTIKTRRGSPDPADKPGSTTSLEPGVGHVSRR